MKVKRFSTITQTGTTGTVTSDSVRLDTYPFVDYVTLQINASSTFTGTIQLQGRTFSDQEWFNIGAAQSASSAATRSVILTRDHAPEFRISATKTSGASSTVDAWIAR